MEKGTRVGRRIILGMLGLGALGIVAGKPLADAVARAGGGIGGPVAALLPAAGGFRLYSVVSPTPDISPESALLRVTGLVEEPRTFTLDDLAALPQTAMTKDFQCVTGWRVEDVAWSGVLLRDVLAACGVTSAGTAVRFTSADGVYTESLTMDQAQRDDMLVATSMLNAPVLRQHGGPIRLYVAPMYGYKSLKWLDGIEVVDSVIPGYWEERGYDVDAWIGESNGRSDEPV
jgi:DMSO/TMAO reductase YedYZ molybdopterin-dependent catalytic subunit